ncbi:hypothetical protein L596_027100 [Steinernema carpocapsae]|uniref:Uncharacterized protein n=1 Tax=Steinernema carpocapsae TaxID=34508 RepID=A0A4U5M3C1_STECR|nr:hypothetical protein L596_027100 [Steinernema carpocapsae]
MDKLEECQEASKVGAGKDLTIHLATLPLEIINDIVTQQEIDRTIIKQLEGPFGDFAHKLLDVCVDSEGIYAVNQREPNRFQWTEASQLNGINISAIYVTDWSTSEDVKTLRLALRGWYKELYVSGDAEEEVLEEAFKDLLLSQPK